MDIEKAPVPQQQAVDEAPADVKILSSDYDIANKILADTGDISPSEFTEEEDRKLRWKIDWHLIPVVSRSRVSPSVALLPRPLTL